MGVRDLFAKLLGKKKEEAIESASTALQSDSTSIESASKRFKALESGPVYEPLRDTTKTSEISEPIELQKDSLRLGIAAGYTSRAIKEIESSLIRIESNMVTRDWFTNQFEDRTPELIDILKKHDENMQKRFESIENSLDLLKKIAEKAPEPIKTELLGGIRAIKIQLPLTSKMKQLISIVREAKEISYEDLRLKLGITRSALRGLLSNTLKRTSEIERFNINGRGWVRYKPVLNRDLKRFKSLESEEKTGEMSLRSIFERVVEKQGFKIVKRLTQAPPDFIIEKNGKSIGVELKLTSDTASLEKGMGQLLFAKTFYNLQELWLVFPHQYKPLSNDWLKTLKLQGIKLFILSQGGLKEL